MTSAIPTRYGLEIGDDRDFGGGDYIAALRARADGTTPAQERRSIIQWLRDKTETGGWQYLWEGNREGAGTPGHANYRDAPDQAAITLMDRIVGSGSPARDINTSWREYDYRGEIVEDSWNKFGMADLLATRALSYPSVQIKNWLDQNPDALDPADREGQPITPTGGVYQRVQQGIRSTYGEPRYDISRGNDPRSFGGADYDYALSVSGDVNATRKEILDWLRDQPYWLTRGNEPGSPKRPEEYDEWSLSGRGGGYGLFDRIEGKGHDLGSGSRDISTAWGDYGADPEAGQFFTHEDLRATRAMGFGDKEIQEWLDAPEQASVLREADKRGKPGGVYGSLDIGPTQTNNPFSTFNTRSRDFSTPDPDSSKDPREGRESLTIGTRKPFAARRADKAYGAKRISKKVRETKDLRRSLNIS